MPRALRITILLGAAAATLVGVAFVALSIERRTHARWTDDVSVRVGADLIEPRRVLWRSATPAPGAISSDADEYEPRIGPDGVTMLLVRRRPGAGAELCTSRWTPEGWSPPAPIASLSSGADELGPELSSDGRQLYFYSDRDGGFGGYDLWVAHAIEGDSERGWSAPINLGPAVNSEHNEYGPALTPDGRTLFFSSNRPRPGEPRAIAGEPWAATLREPRARHDYDLFAATLFDGEARAAEPLVNLNSEHDEGAPAVSPAGDFLWFASDRPGGRGGHDLYRTRLRGGSPTVVELLDEALNSPSNELDPALSADGFRICFSTDRAEPAAPTSGGPSSADSAPDYDLWCSVSREVYLEQPPGRSLADLLRTLWAEQWPWIVALLLLTLLLGLLARLLSDRVWRTRFARLSILTQCLLLSLLLHSALAMLLTLWKVGSVLSDAMGRSGAVQVALTSTGDGAELAEQLRAAVEPLPMSEAVSLGAIAAPESFLSPAALSTALMSTERLDPPEPAERPATVESAPELIAAAPDVTDAATVPASVTGPVAAEEPALVGAAPARLAAAAAPREAAAPASAPARRVQRVALPSTAASGGARHEEDGERRVELPTPLDRAAALGLAAEVAIPSTPSSPAATEEPSEAPARESWTLPVLASGALPIPREKTSVASARGVVAAPHAVHAALPPATRAPRASDSAISPALPTLGSTAPSSAPSPPPPPEPPAPEPRESSEDARSQRLADSSSVLLPALPAPRSRPIDRPLSVPSPRSVATALPPSAAHGVRSAPDDAVDVPRRAEVANRASRTAELPLALPEPVEDFAQRNPDGRTEILAAMGGTAQTEQAVALALEWFARHQAADGRWSSQHFEDAVSQPGALDDASRCEGAAEVKMDLATTSLALLCFLSAGHTHLDDGPHRQRVADAVRWICARQGRDGDLRGDAAGGRETMYGQTIAAVALCEAYAMTKDAALADAAREAAGFVVQQAARSRRGQVAPEDTSVIGWQVMVLASARRAGLGASDEALRATTEAARRWIESVTVAPMASGGAGSTGGFAYRRGEQASVAMTAEAMVVRQLLAELAGAGGDREREALEASAQYVLQELPSWAEGSTTNPTTHHLYYATMALFHQQGEPWRRWNEAVAPALVRQQRRDGCAAGSWDPSDRWAKLGGRLYQTAICTLSLEVYYRYRPGADPR